MQEALLDVIVALMQHWNEKTHPTNITPTQNV
jgi:hypothetical protein